MILDMNNLKPKVIDLFAGVGGLSLGAARAGFHLALAVELDKHAMAAHRLNFPNTNHLMADISTLTAAELLKQAGLKIGELDGLIGGPPCQGFSMIGKRSVLDPRNDLFVKFFELVKECRPKFFIAENVPGILNTQYDEIRKKAFEYVKEGYVLLDPIKLKASDYGAATNRERVFFIGYIPDMMKAISSKDFELEKVDNPTTVSVALRGLPEDISDDWLTEDESWQIVEPLSGDFFWDKVCDDIPEGMGDQETVQRYREKKLVSGCFGTRHSKEVEARYNSLNPGGRDSISKSVRLQLDGFCPTLRAGTASDKGSFQAVRPIHPTLPRVITPREAARLQGFPDWFRFAPSKWHSFRQIGNSVSPILAESIFQVILAHTTCDL